MARTSLRENLRGEVTESAIVSFSGASSRVQTAVHLVVEVLGGVRPRHLATRLEPESELHPAERDEGLSAEALRGRHAVAGAASPTSPHKGECGQMSFTETAKRDV